MRSVDGPTLVFLLIGGFGAAILLLGLLGSHPIGMIGFGDVGSASIESMGRTSTGSTVFSPTWSGP
jgi:hypothetical protein